jgi:hypothetical protein
MSQTDYIVKPLATAAAAIAIDQFFFNESDLNKSLTFGVSAGAGAYLGMMVGSSLPDLSSTLPTFLGNGKGLIQRVSEVGFGVGSAYAVNKFILKNNCYRENTMNKIGAFIAADIAGEYISDYIAGRPLAILS